MVKSTPSNNLPSELTSFIGRERELANLARLLQSQPETKAVARQSKLVTLIGPAGCGKTRLALRVAARLRRHYADGVWWIELAALADPALLPRVIASTLHIPERANQPLLDTLAAHLQAKQCLLILDNCEHVRQAGAEVCQTLLRACPALTILATSREPLQATGETLWPVGALSMPSMDPLPPLATLRQIEAVKLFVARAQAIWSAFELTDANALTVAHICQRLDGIPLAIELAAARVNHLSVEQIANRLNDALSLLTWRTESVEGRQQTLRATLDWSYNLLSSAEQMLLRRLSVFAGGFTLEAVEAVCAGYGLDATVILDLLASLASKSLVAIISLTDDQARYRLLETIRQYGWERLNEMSEEEELRQLHADYYLMLAETAEPHLQSKNQEFYLNQLEVESDNLRSALRLSTADNSFLEKALRLTKALTWFWFMRGQRNEGCQWLNLILERTRTKENIALLRATTLSSAGLLNLAIGNYGEASTHYNEGHTLLLQLNQFEQAADVLRQLGLVTLYEGQLKQAEQYTQQSLNLSQSIGYERGIALALGNLAFIVMQQGDFVRAEPLNHKAISQMETMGDQRTLATAINLAGELAENRGDFRQAIEKFEESLAVDIDIGYKGGMATNLVGLARVMFNLGQISKARDRAIESLKLWREIGDNLGVAECFDAFADIAGALSQPKLAACLFSVADNLRVSLGSASFPRDKIRLKYRVSRACSNLTEMELKLAWAEGRSLEIEEAVASALAIQLPQDAPNNGIVQTPLQAAKVQYDGLTRREREIAALIAQGQSNQDIADTLVITLGTVEAHVSHILRKLNFASRAQVAAWAVERELAEATPKPIRRRKR